MDQHALQALLFAVARQLLAAVDGAQTGRVCAVLTNGRLKLELSQREPPQNGGGGSPCVLGGFSDADARLLDILSTAFFNDLERSAVLALASKPLPAHAAARRIGAGISRTKVLLTGLADRGVLRTSRDGYEVTHLAFIELARRENPHGGSEKG